MKAQNKRHIRATKSFDHLIPQSIQKDTVVVGSGKAKLEDTLQLMQVVVQQTKKDTEKLSKVLKGTTKVDTCKRIWDFVYQHIQYKMDKTGIEQVRRPSRTWSDRMTGVDCDCYTVFIGSILTNLGIPFTMRITKYGGKHHFQHVYPIVPTPNGYITMDCVTDQFNHEVPFSEKQDIVLTKKIININGLGSLSGVDMADIELNALEQPSIPLRKVIQQKRRLPSPAIPDRNAKLPVAERKGRVSSPFRFEDGKKLKTRNSKKNFNLLNFLILSGISVAAGIGVLKLLSTKTKGKTGSTKSKNTSNTKDTNKSNKKTKRSKTS